MNRELLEKAYLAGFMASHEGWNSDYPFTELGSYPHPGKGSSPTEYTGWIEQRDEDLRIILIDNKVGVQNGQVL